MPTLFVVLLACAALFVGLGGGMIFARQSWASVPLRLDRWRGELTPDGQLARITCHDVAGRAVVLAGDGATLHAFSDDLLKASAAVRLPGAGRTPPPIESTP